MKNLSNDLITHIAITYSKTKYYLTEAQHQKLLTLDNKASIIIGASFLKVSSIGEVLPLEDYYRSHPKDRPQYGPAETFPENPRPIKMSEEKMKAKRIRRITQMIKGITRYISLNTNNKKAQETRAKMEEGLGKVVMGEELRDGGQLARFTNV